MTVLDRYRRDWLIIRIIADEVEAREREQCTHADARARVRALSPTLAGQVWPQPEGDRE